jgi:DNA invertase Pin-like site-specific DNA recombinase
MSDAKPIIMPGGSDGAIRWHSDHAVQQALEGVAQLEWAIVDERQREGIELAKRKGFIPAESDLIS